MSEWISPVSIYSSCGSDGGDFTPDKFIDGNLGTKWRHQVNETHECILDLGATKTVEQIRIYAGDINCEGGPVHVYVSDNPEVWGASVGSFSVSGYPAWSGCDVTDKDGRYIKLLLTDWRGSNDYLHTSEFEAYTATPWRANLDVGDTDVADREDIALAIVA